MPLSSHNEANVGVVRTNKNVEIGDKRTIGHGELINGGTKGTS